MNSTGARLPFELSPKVPLADTFLQRGRENVLPVADDIAFIVAVGFVGLALFLAFLAFTETDDKAGRFERCYATVDARVAEGVFWLIHHLRRARARDEVEARLEVAFVTLFFTASTLLVPLCAIYAGQRKELEQHGIAFGIGALAWGCVLESATLPPRVRALAPRATRPLPRFVCGS